jgi:hypothetical protein
MTPAVGPWPQIALVNRPYAQARVEYPIDWAVPIALYEPITPPDLTVAKSPCPPTELRSIFNNRGVYTADRKNFKKICRERQQ